MESIIKGIDNAVGSLSGVRPGSHYIAQAASKYLNSKMEEKEHYGLCNEIVGFSVENYLSTATPLSNIFSFTDRQIDFLFDCKKTESFLCMQKHKKRNQTPATTNITTDTLAGKDMIKDILFLMHKVVSKEALIIFIKGRV